MIQQKFKSNVGQAIQAEQLIQHINVGSSRLLSPTERRVLNFEVREIVKGTGMHAAGVWMQMHRSVGVDSVEQICVEHLPTLNVVLDILREDADRLRALLDSLKQLKQAQASVEELRIEVEELKSRLAEQTATSLAPVESTDR